MDLWGDGQHLYWHSRPGVFGRSKLVWDGMDGSPSLGSSALPGLDLAAGAWNAFGLTVDSLDFFLGITQGISVDMLIAIPGAGQPLSQSIAVARFIDSSSYFLSTHSLPGRPRVCHSSPPWV